MIRTSKLSTKLMNVAKKEKLTFFLVDYKTVVNDFIDMLWQDLNEKFECPKFISTKDYVHPRLSQRAIKCASTQACSMVKSATEQKRKLLWTIEKLSEDSSNNVDYLNQKLEKIKVVKPTLPSNFKCELNSICCDLLVRNGIWFLQLKSIGKHYGKIRIPLKPHRQTNRWKEQGSIKNSFLISESFVDVRFEMNRTVKNKGKVVGLDQGITTCITLSDGQITGDDPHGWNLTKILNKLATKKKGSKGFSRIQALRKNYINWSINQLNFSDIKQINVEKLRNVRKGKNTNRFMSGWTYAAILDKLKMRCEEQKVFVKEQSCTYRSQRCSACGIVLKGQRKGKLFSCNCGFICDSDLNASLNHEIDLPDISFLRHLKLNISGFYWSPSGVFNLNGNEFTVRCANKDKIIHFV